MSKVLTYVIAAVLILGACGPAPTSAATGTDVAATLTDTAIQLDQPSAAAGTITFKAQNKGTVLHSLLLIKTDVPADKLPTDPKDAARVDRTGEVRETAQIPLGGTASFSAKLAPGSYVLICNEPGHYLIGMHTPFAVK